MIGSAAPAVASPHVLHAVIAPPDVLVDERRTLYRLACEVYAPGTGLSDKLLDHPMVRYELGRALAGHDDLTAEILVQAAQINVRDAAGVDVVSDDQATVKLATALRIIAPEGARPQVLTEADGDRFTRALALVGAGVELFRRLAPKMADDLLAHLDLLAVLKTESSGGVVSASTRYLPGLVLIEEPSTPIEVAEALVHECSHLKFFDFSVTREFLDGRAVHAEHFINSWSNADWPLEQTFAAWHAYTALAYFYGFCDSHEMSSVSLLPMARNRAAEIGSWLLLHEEDLGSHARWLLRAQQGAGYGEEQKMRGHVERGSLAEEDLVDGHIQLASGVMRARAASGRIVVARVAAGLSPDLFWLDEDSSWVVSRCSDGGAIELVSILAAAAREWEAEKDVVMRRLRAVLKSLRQSSLLVERLEKRPDPEKD
ncbi:HEXXH motif-containing protein [Lentzea atacamensis]|uniref:HEXXH motif-containing protein n=1 Tax=Lentzea atacamensis TaxID=531938 RepID=A0A316HTZ0_9PSEU|nr:HEXXH motif-containing protein [Lentzea atacamensis]